MIQRYWRGYLSQRLDETGNRIDMSKRLITSFGEALDFAVKWQKTLYTYVEEGDNPINKAVSGFVLVLIVVATVGFVLETVRGAGQ